MWPKDPENINKKFLTLGGNERLGIQNREQMEAIGFYTHHFWNR